MKAILVIDVPNENLWKTSNDIYERMKGYKCSFKPMPLKRETRVYWKSVGLGNIPTHEISDYDKGWNDCVEFLEGEEND